jgi:hypothetical protein
METDALRDFKFKSEGGSDLYVVIKEGEPQKLRVLTLDPIVHLDKFGNTRYAFVVYNYTAQKAQILAKGSSIAKPLSDLHNDEDYEALNKIDIKISATGEGMETRYQINVLPKTETLTPEQIKEAANIKLEEIIKNGIRMSEINKGTPMPKVEETSDNYPVTDEDMTEEINLSEIPF